MEFIDIDTFKEGVNYFNTNSKKYQIILLDTNKDIETYNASLESRMRGTFNRIPAFSISKKGVVYRYYDPFKCYSKVMKNEAIDKISITIALENYGLLEQSVDTGELFDQYKNKINVKLVPFEQEWRGFNLWDRYTMTQTYKLIELLEYLFNNSDIDRNVVTSNVYMDNAIKFKGILTRSNYHKFYLDTNPALNLELIKNEIVGYE